MSEPRAAAGGRRQTGDDETQRNITESVRDEIFRRMSLESLNLGGLGGTLLES